MQNSPLNLPHPLFEFNITVVMKIAVTSRRKSTPVSPGPRRSKI